MQNKTFRDIYYAWEEDKRHYVKESTMSAYLLIMENHIMPYFEDYTKFEEEDVQKFVLKKLDDGLSEKTVKDMIVVLKMVVRFGMKKHWLDYTEWKIRYPTKKEIKHIQVFSVAENKKLLKYLKENFSFRNLGLYLCLTTGLRIGEICALKWSDIDTANGILNVQRTIERIYDRDTDMKHTKIIISDPKTASSFREIPLTREILPKIKSLMKVVNADYYVVSNSEEPIEPHTYRCYYTGLLEKLGLPRIKFHGMRHTFATRCIESNCDYKTVSALLGHADIETTLNLYVHPNDEHKRKCLDNVFKSLGK